jgi:glutamate synthase (ferredoxin)
MVFLPKKENQADFARRPLKLLSQSKFDIGWRDVPVDVSNLGQIAAEKNR